MHRIPARNLQKEVKRTGKRINDVNYKSFFSLLVLKDITMQSKNNNIFCVYTMWECYIRSIHCIWSGILYEIRLINQRFVNSRTTIKWFLKFK